MLTDAIVDRLITSDKHLFWILHISEFKELFCLYNVNQEVFNKVVNEKISLEQERNPNDRSISTIIDKYNIRCPSITPDHFSRFYDQENQILKHSTNTRTEHK